MTSPATSAGVSFWSRHDRRNGKTATVIGNTGQGTWALAEVFATAL